MKDSFKTSALVIVKEGSPSLKLEKKCRILPSSAWSRPAHAHLDYSQVLSI